VEFVRTNSVESNVFVALQPACYRQKADAADSQPEASSPPILTPARFPRRQYPASHCCIHPTPQTSSTCERKNKKTIIQPCFSGLDSQDVLAAADDDNMAAVWKKSAAHTELAMQGCEEG
jgi:hypothetical protein